jgi:hypothetical protein
MYGNRLPHPVEEGEPIMPLKLLPPAGHILENLNRASEKDVFSYEERKYPVR